MYNFVSVTLTLYLPFCFYFHICTCFVYVDVVNSGTLPVYNNTRCVCMCTYFVTLLSKTFYTELPTYYGFVLLSTTYTQLGGSIQTNSYNFIDFILLRV